MSFGDIDNKQLKRLQEELEAFETTKRDEMMRGALDEMCKLGLATLKEHTPVDETGRLRDSWKVDDEVKISNSGKTYWRTARNETHYASWVDKGHKQQVGRYVPKIKARLKRPFVPGSHFVMKAELDMNRKKPVVLDKFIERKLMEVLDGK